MANLEKFCGLKCVLKSLMLLISDVLYYTCEELVQLLLGCEELVPIPHTCAESMQFPHICEEFVCNL